MIEHHPSVQSIFKRTFSDDPDNDDDEDYCDRKQSSKKFWTKDELGQIRFGCVSEKIQNFCNMRK